MLAFFQVPDDWKKDLVVVGKEAGTVTFFTSWKGTVMFMNRRYASKC